MVFYFWVALTVSSQSAHTIGKTNEITSFLQCITVALKARLGVDCLAVVNELRSLVVFSADSWQRRHRQQQPRALGDRGCQVRIWGF